MNISSLRILTFAECSVMSGAGGRSGAEDAQEIYSRLFNHRPFVQGGLKHFVRYISRKNILTG